MLFGLEGFTLFHIAISLLAIAAGFVVVGGFLANARLGWVTALFLATTVATSVTGFGFPFTELLPSHIVGIISLVILAIAIYARYAGHLVGAWRWVFVATATAALYLNVFVLIVQTFIKNPALKVLAPTQSELPFVAVQGLTLVAFVGLGLIAVQKFKTTAV